MGSEGKDEEDVLEALAELDALLKEDPQNEELLQMRAELTGVQEQLNENVEAKKSNAEVIEPEEPSSFIGPQIPEDFKTSIPAMVDENPDTSNGGHVELDYDENENANKPETSIERFYTVEPNFAELTSKDEKFAAFVKVNEKGRGFIDFKDANASRELTRALLKHDFGIQWSLAEGQLIPPVKNRINYIHWLEDLLEQSSPAGPVSGLDVGCGANLVYCLLGAKVNKWKMTGLDITEEARQGAQKNLEANPGLARMIDIVINMKPPGNPTQGILSKILDSNRKFTFSMCNPPFFESLDEAEQNPATAHQGTSAEMVCQGGELAFVRQMVQESVERKESVHWYTTMLGKKSTLKTVRQDLQKVPTTAVRVTEFIQGRTSRWGLAWSFVAAVGQSQKRARANQSTPLIIKRSTVIMLTAPQASPMEVLKMTESFFERQGHKCKTDLATFSLTMEGYQASPDSQKTKLQKTASIGSSGYSIFVSVALERKGVYAIRAKIPVASENTVAEAFTRLMSDAEEFLQSSLR